MATFDPAVAVNATASSGQAASWFCDQLERGKIIFFERVPFDFSEDDRNFLLAQKQADSRFHKNISYRPVTDALNGVSANSPDRERLHRVMKNFSGQTAQFLAQFLAPYAGKLKMDFASFRPLEEQGRDLSLHKRNDLLHVDAFPSRPTNGGRILRFFININPAQERVWKVGEPFHDFLPRVAKANRLNPPYRSAAVRAMARMAAGLGLPMPVRSRYDEFMLYLHDWLKESDDFQKNSGARQIEFPPGCSWMVYTDGVPHAVLSGQYALEQTFIVPRSALVTQEVAPVSVLETTTGTRMAT